MAEEENEKENSQTTEEEETSKPSEETEEVSEETEEKPQEEEQETPEKPEATSTELEEKNKRLYARMKKAEEEAKLAKEELEKGKEKKPSELPTNIFDLAKTVATLKEYSPEELDFIQMIAKSKDISPEEAAKTEEAKLYISARRQKVEAEKLTPEPSTKTAISKKPLEKITAEDVSRMSQKEKEEYYIKIGWMAPPRKPPRER